MKFRNTRTGEELKGAKQIGNRLRYQFGRFSQQHEGEYICEARNAYGEKANKTAYIKMECEYLRSDYYQIYIFRIVKLLNHSNIAFSQSF